MAVERNLARARSLLFTATRLLALARELELEAEGEENHGTTRLEPSDAVLVELARQIYHARRERSVLVNWQDLFGEPAWDMLLDLYVAAHENREVSVTSACLAAEVPTTTALRWLGMLQAKGIVVRYDDPGDRRRRLVRISASSFAEFNRYLRHIADGHSAFTMLAPPNRVSDPGVSQAAGTAVNPKTMGPTIAAVPRSSNIQTEAIQPDASQKYIP